MAGDRSDDARSVLESIAREIRRDIVRGAPAAGSTDPGVGLAVADVVAALLFHDPTDDLGRPDRDRLVLSSTRAAPALRAALARRSPYTAVPGPSHHGAPPTSPEGGKSPMIDATRMGPGEGIGIAIGRALDARLAGRTHRIVCLIDEEECRAGGSWEALSCGSRLRLGRLLVIINHTARTIDERTEGADSIVQQLRAVHCHTLEVDGHDLSAILMAFSSARKIVERPTAIVARTVHGKGVSFLEARDASPDSGFSKEEAVRALEELGVGPGGGER
jgi:transketolase